MKVQVERFFEFEDGKKTSEIIQTSVLRDLLDIGEGAASVSVGAGYTLPFGYAKCYVQVSLSCSQDLENIESAYATGIKLAQFFAQDGIKKVAAPVVANDGNMWGSHG